MWEKKVCLGDTGGLKKYVDIGRGFINGKPGLKIYRREQVDAKKEKKTVKKKGDETRGFPLVSKNSLGAGNRWRRGG